MSLRVLLSLGLVSLLAPQGWTQAKPGDPKEETAETSDGVKLRCRFYAAAKESNKSCVILLHDYNADPDDKKTDWDGLRELILVIHRVDPQESVICNRKPGVFQPHQCNVVDERQISREPPTSSDNPSPLISPYL